MFTARIAEIQMGFGNLHGITISPEGEERIVGIDRSAGIIMVHRTIVGYLFINRPSLAMIRADPEAHFTARAPRLRAGLSRGNHFPFIAINIKTAHVIVMADLGNDAGLPHFAIPA